MVAALSCRKSMQKRRLSVLFLDHNHWRGPRAVGWTDDAACQHLLDLGHFFSPDSGVLPTIGLTEGRPFGFNGVLQQRGAAKIILSLADAIAEFLEEVFQLLLLDGATGVPGQVAGEEGWRRLVEAESQRWRQPLGCPHSRQNAGSGRWLWIATHTSEPLESAGTPDTNVGRASSGQK